MYAIYSRQFVPTLAYLALNDNELEGEIPTEIGNLNRLQTLQLHGNDLSGFLPTEFGRLTALRKFIFDIKHIC